jgi:hypothetical protein
MSVAGGTFRRMKSNGGNITWQSSAAFFVVFASVSSSSLSGCATSSQTVQVLPSLTPIDASRPFYVYKSVKGTGCGDNAIASAMDDLYRVAGDAHGFVSVTIEQQLGDQRCVTISARPISYGCAPNEPKKVDVYPMHVVPGPTECTAASDTCMPDCTRYSQALGSGSFETAAFRERCVTRCRAADSAFLTCARAVAAPADVRQCDSLR